MDPFPASAQLVAEPIRAARGGTTGIAGTGVRRVARHCWRRAAADKLWAIAVATIQSSEASQPRRRRAGGSEPAGARRIHPAPPDRDPAFHRPATRRHCVRGPCGPHRGQGPHLRARQLRRLDEPRGHLGARPGRCDRWRIEPYGENLRGGRLPIGSRACGSQCDRTLNVGIRR